MGVIGVVSFRLGLHDGVSVVAQAWQRSFHDLGWDTFQVAGEGPVEHLIPGLRLDAQDTIQDRIDPFELEKSLLEPLSSALAEADIVLVENLFSIPLNLPASRALATVLRDRPAIVHHHDPPWQRERFAHITELPPDDRAWRHVTINRLTEQELADRGFEAVTIYNGFDTRPDEGERDATRIALGINQSDASHPSPLVAHPVRAIARKNIAGAIAVAEALGGTYWLSGPAEEGYEPELQRLISAASCPVLRTPLTNDRSTDGLSVADLYAASDVVVFPSTWEGFGNPPVEAAIFDRPAVVGNYPVADELRQMGMAWYGLSEVERLGAALSDPGRIGLGPGGVDSLSQALFLNRQLVEKELSLERMTRRIADLLATLS